MRARTVLVMHIMWQYKSARPTTSRKADYTPVDHEKSDRLKKLWKPVWIRVWWKSALKILFCLPDSLCNPQIDKSKYTGKSSSENFVLNNVSQPSSCNFSAIYILEDLRHTSYMFHKNIVTNKLHIPVILQSFYEAV